MNKPSRYVRVHGKRSANKAVRVAKMKDRIDRRWCRRNLSPEEYSDNPGQLAQNLHIRHYPELVR